jgi:capsular polysaccharide biosynthesis protein
MSQQALDLRTSMLIVRRHKLLVGIVMLLAILGSGAYAMTHPPMLTGTALVVLPQTSQSTAAAAAAGAGNNGTDPYTATQEVIAGSNAVLTNALQNVRPPMTLDALRRDVQVGSLTPYVISISAQSKVAGNAEATANAVASSYIHLIGSANSPVGRVSAQLLESATSATGPTPAKQLIIYALLGAVLGALLGVVIALAVGRHDRRLRERDEIADSIGVPVLVSVSASSPRDAAGWTRLLQSYDPGAVDAWRLHKALHQLGAVGVNPAEPKAASGSSLAVLSLASDRNALALGPQLAVFAASLGIRTALVVGPQQDINATAVLRAACAAPATSQRSRNLQACVVDRNDSGTVPDAALTVVVAVVDGQTPRVAETMRAAVTVLGVSAGAVNAGQLARVAASAAADGRDIAGILVADPDSADPTTGRVPRLVRPDQSKMPTRITGRPTEARK